MEWLKQIFRRRYVVLLEEEVARLRAENRGLMNSLLGTAGHPPLEAPQNPMPVRPSMGRRSWHQIQRTTERGSEQRIIERMRHLAKAGSGESGAGGGG